MKRIAILLEDDLNVRGALELLLDDLGWEPVAAQTANEALTLLRSPEAVCAIITDFNLGDGITGVEEVVTLTAAGVAAPVLVMSSSMRGKAEKVARSAGHAYLSKPVAPDRVEAWLAALG